MLTAYIAPGALTARWILTDTGWAGVAGSTLEPYAHPALESFSLVAGRRRAFIVREKARGQGHAIPADIPVRAEEFDQHLARLRDWPLDFFLIAMPARREDPVILQCGAWGVAPVSLVEDHDGLRLNWDVAKLYACLRGTLDRERAAYMLGNMVTPYSRRTLFPELLQMTERAVATWRPGRPPIVDYPPPVPHSLARRLAPDADVLATFEHLLSAVIARWSADGSVGPCELSGGLDSSSVAVTASRISCRPIRTYGLIMPGWEGDAQVLRRSEVIQACGACDVPVTGIAYAPFHAGQRGLDDAMLLSGEYYHEAFRVLLGRVRADGGSTILRGIGGDEVSQIQYGEFDPQDLGDEAEGRRDTPSFLTRDAREAAEAARSRLDTAPQGAADRSVYEAMAASSVVYLRSGIWPRYPYAARELAEFCRRLPAEWRAGRTLQRRYLAKFGLSQRVWDPDPKESFIRIMHHGLGVAGRPFVERMFADSRLAAMGLVSADGLRASYRHFVATEDASEADYLLTAACLEASLRAVEQASGGSADVDRHTSREEAGSAQLHGQQQPA